MLDDQKELFIVVDKDDTIIDYRTRYDCHHDKSLIHRAIGIIIYNDKNEVLLQKRSMLKDTAPGLYTISVSGHVTKGQTYEEAAYREMEEELGIQTKITHLTKFLCKMDVETEIDEIFIAKHNGPFKIAKDEIEYVKFFNKNKIMQIKGQISPWGIKCLQEGEVL